MDSPDPPTVSDQQSSTESTSSEEQQKTGRNGIEEACRIRLDLEKELTPSSPHIVRTKKSRRKVSFPEDNKIVHKEIPPHNPWSNAKETCTEELVAAYHAACVTNKVKPLQRIIQQLQKIDDFSNRIEVFSLQGEKVDSRVVESLEEIFRRVQFRTLDLEGTNLDDEASGALFDMVEFYESAIKINLSSNKNIGVRGWQCASRMMRKSCNLQVVDLSRTSWSEHSVPILCRALRVDTSVTSLHLEACNLAGRSHVLLMSALRLNGCIRELFLADNRLMPSDAFHIGGMLKHNMGLKLLDLRNNNLQDVGTSHISDGLTGQMRGQLNTLVLWNNHITHTGAGHLGKTLPMITTLETLNIGQNNLGTDGIMKLKDGLTRNKFLQRLGLYGCRINDEGAVALAEYLADNCQLVRLDVRDNDIRTGGLMALSHSLKLNKVLLRLDLDKDVKKDPLTGYEELQQNLLDDIGDQLTNNRLLLERLQKEKEEQEAVRIQEGEDSLVWQNIQNTNKEDGGESRKSLNSEGLNISQDVQEEQGFVSKTEASNNCPSTSKSSVARTLQTASEVEDTPSALNTIPQSADMEAVPTDNGTVLDQVLSNSGSNDNTEHVSTNSDLSQVSAATDQNQLIDTSTSSTSRQDSSDTIADIPGTSSNSLNQSSPPGIRINDSIKLLTLPLHGDLSNISINEKDVDMMKGLDRAGQDLIASAIEPYSPMEGSDPWIPSSPEKEPSTSKPSAALIPSELLKDELLVPDVGKISSEVKEPIKASTLLSCSPDDFEQEIDQMMANMNNLFPSPNILTVDNPQG